MADDFLTTYAPLANDIATQTGVDPSVVLGIIDTETGGGQHVSGNNIFGITPGGRVAGYPDVQTAAQAFVGLMKTPRYAGVAAAPDPASQAAALVKSGYNTVNPAYATIVANKALSIGKQLGYQGQDEQTAQASAPDYNNTPSPVQSAPASEPPASPSAKGQLQQELTGGGSQTSTTSTPPPNAQPSSAKEQLKQELSGGGQQPAGTGQTGAPAKPSIWQTIVAPGDTDLSKGYVAPDGSYVPPQAIPSGPPPSAAPGAPPPPATPAPVAVGDTLVWPEDMARINAPPSQPPIASLEDFRDRAQASEINLLKAMAPDKDAGPVETFARKVATTGVHALATPVQMGINALVGLSEGPTGGVTWNPQTKTFGLTPEAQAAATFAANPLRFSGANALVREPPSILTQAGVMKPLPVTVDELRAAIARAGPEPPSQPGGGAGPQPAPPSGGGGTAAPSQPTGGAWRPVQPGEIFQPGGNYRMNVATGGQEVFEPTSAAAPATPSATPPPVISERPQLAAAGAEVTTEPIPEKTLTQKATDIRKDVAQTAAERAGQSLRDDNTYFESDPPIPPRIEAFRDFSPQRALDHKYYYGKDTDYRAQVDAINTERHAGMTDALKEDMGDSNTLADLIKYRKEVTPDEMGVFENEQPVNPNMLEGFRANLEGLINGPFSKRSGVRGILENVYNSLFDKDGKIEVLPSRLQGVRDNMTDWLDKKSGSTDVAKDVQAGQSVLTKLVDDLNPVMNSGAPLWDQWRQEWAKRSQPINQQAFLQNYEPGRAKSLWDPNGKLVFRKVQTMLSDIANAMDDKSVHNAHSLTDAQIQKIVQVKNELATEDFARRQAEVPGSPTHQLFERAAKEGGTTLGAVAQMATDLTLHGAALYAAGHGVPLINPAIGVWQGTRPLRQARTAANKRAVMERNVNALKQDLLSQKGPPNPLQP